MGRGQGLVIIWCASGLCAVQASANGVCECAAVVLMALVSLLYVAECFATFIVGPIDYI